MWTSGIGKISLFLTLVAFVLGYGEFATHPHAASVHGAVEQGGFLSVGLRLTHVNSAGTKNPGWPGTRPA